jgi:hypothetical protein
LKEAMGKKFLRAKTGLDTEQLWFITSILITPRTWGKSKVNKFLQKKNWAAQHLYIRGNLVYRKHKLANLP